MLRLSAEAVAAAGGKEAVMPEDEQAPAQRGHGPPRYPDTPAKRAASSEHTHPGGAPGGHLGGRLHSPQTFPSCNQAHSAAQVRRQVFSIKPRRYCELLEGLEAGTEPGWGGVGPTWHHSRRRLGLRSCLYTCRSL